MTTIIVSTIITILSFWLGFGYGRYSEHMYQEEKADRIEQEKRMKGK